MTALDKTIRPLASSLLKRYGKTISISYPSAAAYNVASSSAVVTSVSYTVKAIITNAKASFFGSDLIQQDDLFIMIAAQGITEPPLGATVTIDSKGYQVVDVKTQYSGELPATYQLQIR